MVKKHIITIAGDHASGQGTLSDKLHERLGYEIYRNGQYIRQLAKSMGMSIIKFQEYLDEHEELDREIEKKASEYANTHDNLIIDAKLGWYSVPNSFKVYLKVNIDVAALRIFHDEKRRDTEKSNSIDEVKQKIVYRYNEESTRWFKTYGIKREDMSNYDLIIDTTHITPDEVCDEVIKAYQEWLKK